MARRRVHLNLHNGLFAVVDPSTGRVERYAERVALSAARFVVRPAGRAAVVASGRRSVHAYVIGDIVDEPASLTGMVEVSYNPFRSDCFTTRTGGFAVHAAALAVCADRVVWVEAVEIGAAPTEEKALF